MNYSNRPKARVAVVEDDFELREYFSEIIGKADTLRLAWSAADLAQARAKLRHRVDLVLLDIGLPDGDGLSLLPMLKANDTRALIITAFGDRETVINAIQKGANGYLLKSDSEQEIIEGIEATLEGGAPVSASAAVFLLEALRKPSNVRAPIKPDELTLREVEVLQAFAKGQTYKQTARTLGISPLTVGAHVKSIYRKLEVHSRTEAVFAALKEGKVTL
uniref:response regulator n=1 Tax=uncultured Erythrobacter sp. TaxID=263913 RepID=UPI002610AE9A|nr:response regulator transcription factor [uncultured Erythrobacter sp.]